MKKVLLFIGFLLCFNVLSAKPLTPVGTWIQISDTTGQPHSMVQIYEKHGKLFGKVVKAFPENGVPPRKYCDTCPGKLHNAPIIGLPIMKDLDQTDDHVWSNGTIMDPKDGKIYRCKLTLNDDGQRLDVRGYMGFSLLGRSQTWIRKS